MTALSCRAPDPGARRPPARRQVLRTAYTLRMRTPDEVRPALPDWGPLPQGPSYAEFQDFPAGG